MKVRKWINSMSGVNTRRITVRVEHHLSLHEIVDGLCSLYARNWVEDEDGPHPKSLTAEKILKTVRNEYRDRGRDYVWTWADGMCYSEAEAHRAHFHQVVLAAFPDFRD